MPCLSRPYPLKFFKGSLPHNLFSLMLITLSQIRAKKVFSYGHLHLAIYAQTQYMHEQKAHPHARTNILFLVLKLVLLSWFTSDSSFILSLLYIYIQPNITARQTLIPKQYLNHNLEFILKIFVYKQIDINCLDKTI